MISTGSVHAVEKMSSNIGEILERDYAGVIKRKLDDVYRMAGSVTPAFREKVERDNRTAFIVSCILTCYGLAMTINTDPSQ